VSSVKRQVLWQQWALANQRHVAAKHIPESWEFVQTSGAEKTTKTGLADGFSGKHVFICARRAHGAKLSQHEQFSAQNRVPPADENGGPVEQVNGDGDDSQ
jgi:hypothetical protein